MINKLFTKSHATPHAATLAQTRINTSDLSVTGRSLGREEGIPWVWVCGGALVTILLMIFALFGIILSQGLSALWPSPVVAFPMPDGTQAVGVPLRIEETTDTTSGRAQVTQKTVLYAANRDFNQVEFVYIDKDQLKKATKLPDLWFVERLEWGPFIGAFQNITEQNEGGNLVVLPNPSASDVHLRVQQALERLHKMDQFESKHITPLNHEIEVLRVKRRGLIRRAQVTEGASNVSEIQQIDAKLEDLNKQVQVASATLSQLREQDGRSTATLKSLLGTVKELRVSQIVRAFQPNQLSVLGRMRVYLSRVWEFVSQEPREANTAGGVFPAIFGTVAMTLLMTLAVLPVGVLTAVYMREIAKQGFLVSFVRIAVGNLAGVPSIVYGVFGLGFFCYTVGSSIDRLLFSDKLPNPTFGTGGILWASLTLALLTVPVVIVSTEEALSTVPRTLREASYGCGATRLQTLLHIVLPKAMPGIMTGLILAMARGVGEVAPLLMTGVVKLAPALPIDAQFPYVHLERSFMHLGFHIYDLGFQSRSTEMSRPMVFATTTLLVGIVLALNFVAIKIRSRLRLRFEGRGAF